MTQRKLSRATAYVDNKDSKRRWAWCVTFWDGHEESGAMPNDVYDAGEALVALVNVVTGNGGVWAEGKLEHVDFEGGYWLWRSNESLAHSAAWRARGESPGLASAVAYIAKTIHGDIWMYRLRFSDGREQRGGLPVDGDDVIGALRKRVEEYGGTWDDSREDEGRVRVTWSAAVVSMEILMRMAAAASKRHIEDARNCWSDEDGCGERRSACELPGPADRVCGISADHILPDEIDMLILPDDIVPRVEVLGGLVDALACSLCGEEGLDGSQ